MDKAYKCPWCGCEDMVKGVQAAYANVMSDRFKVGVGQKLHHIICKNCGSVVRSYVEHPEKLDENK